MKNSKIWPLQSHRNAIQSLLLQESSPSLQSSSHSTCSRHAACALSEFQGRLSTHFTLNTVAPFSHCIMIPPTLLSCWWLLGMNSTCHGLMSGRKADSQERNPLEKVVKSEQRKVAHRHKILCSREKGVTSCIATDLTSSFSYPRSSCLKNEKQWVM